ncbi:MULTISPECIES: 3-keto-disaccharide hydrolase [Chitinophagaceae]
MMTFIESKIVRLRKILPALCLSLGSCMVIVPGYSQVAQVKAGSVEGGTLVGRWDITVNEDGVSRPSWLEVEISGFETLVGRFVATGGSARPISKVHFNNGKFSFEIPPQWEKSDKDLKVEGTITKDRIEGIIHEVNGKDYTFTGVPAPFMTEKKDVRWGKPIQLFNGKDLTGWKTSGTNQWIVQNGVLISPHSGSNLISEQKFNDFKLHVEFKYSKNSNSGVYLRGRYEVQIIDNPVTDHPNSHLFGGVYGFLTPSEMAVKGPDEWQSYDITLVGRMVTVVANGKTIICNQEIPGITGGAIDANEAQAGPIYFQGDHGPIQFRNIVITPAK